MWTSWKAIKSLSFYFSNISDVDLEKDMTCPSKIVWVGLEKRVNSHSRVICGEMDQLDWDHTERGDINKLQFAIQEMVSQLVL